jgi:Cu-Zn family superoxide dismutase
MLKSVLTAAPVLALAACGHIGHSGQDMLGAGHGEQITHTPETGASPMTIEPAAATATLLDADGQEIGKARFEQGPTGVLIRMEIGAGGLTPGWHGVHLHEIGDCSDVGTFQLSGGHHGKEAGAHGLMNPDRGPEAGDLPNAWAGADGSAGYEAFTMLTELAPALGADGLSIIVHANEDDHRSQPIGGAGPRVACGVVTRTDR